MGDQVKEMIADGKKRDLRLYVAVSKYDYISGSVDANRESTELVALLEGNGYEPVVEKVGDGVGWASWASRTDQILATLFPARE